MEEAGLMVIDVTRMNLRMLSIAIICLLALGCSSGETNPFNPGEDIRNSAATYHSLMGLWQFEADPVAQSLDVIELRSADVHLNVLPFLEPPPLLNLTLESLEFNGNLIDCEIGLRHPFLGLTEFSGFDVCGILISNGSVTGFNDPDICIAGEGDTRLLNPDGWARWWNPAEFPTTGTVFGYNDGLLGAPDSFADFNCTLNGYKYFCDDLNSDDSLDAIDPLGRGMFTPGQKNVRLYQIELGVEGLIFNYAIDACWEFPEGDPPWVAPDDFSPNANRPEPYRLSISEIDKTLFYDPEEEMAEGEVTLLIDVYDWFDAGLNTISVECGSIFTPLTTTVSIGGGAGYSTYSVDILDAQPATAGPLDLFITAASADVGYQGLVPGKQVASYFTYVLDVPLGEIQQGFPCGENEISEDFDALANGSGLPSPWVNIWSGYPTGCHVTTEQSFSSPHSYRLEGYSSWSRYDGYPFTRKDHFCLETQMMITDPTKVARMGLCWKTSGSTTGHLRYFAMGTGYTPYQWYHVYAEVDCIENTWEVWVDDELKVSNSWTDETPENSFIWFFIGIGNFSTSGTGVVYFDDVTLTWED